MIVQFQKELYNQLLGHSLQKFPEEACGLILGEPSPSIKDILAARTFVPIQNISHNPRNHFELNPIEMIPFLTDRHNPVIGLFHSHPSAPAIPSEIDLQTLWHTIPTYWILSLQHTNKPELHLYQIKNATPTGYHKLRFVIGQ
ncbi:M67 family metallopeptidase [Paenibacillus planticolens]|uniref:M67 family metallopeptidase n=1 Tax=Paenibacillus planticolens TaxID=2654976 RepID=UPI0014916C11|nr:M67 family metallopeptidase [Paenibacillus planticolens]